MQNREIIVFSSTEQLAAYVGDLFVKGVAERSEGTYFSVALSGGSTPKRIFQHISAQLNHALDWHKVRFFWGDERCVPPDHDESNYNMTRQYLLEHLDIPETNIFRIFGEAEPAGEAQRYSKIIAENTPLSDGFPCFDLVLLGMGEDGHTASIFPGHTELFQSPDFCAAVAHPQTGQERITITGRVINNAKQVVFLVTGSGKSEMVARILEHGSESGLPASFVHPKHGLLVWALDAAAASKVANAAHFVEQQTKK